jgi:hypothetical protein
MEQLFSTKTTNLNSTGTRKVSQDTYISAIKQSKFHRKS